MLHLPFTHLSPDHIVAWRGEQPIRNSIFQTEIESWRALLANTTGHKFALYLSDSFEFASALIGGWLANKTLYLPSNTLPDTCINLRNIVDGFLGEFPAEYLPFIPSAERSNKNILLKELNAEHEGLVIYTSGSTGNAQAIPKRLAQLAAEVATLEKLFGHLIDQADILTTVSHEHIYGLLFKILWPITSGRAFHVRSATYIEELMPILSSRSSVLVSTPTHLKRLRGDLHSTVNLKYLRAVFSSGSLLAPEVADATQQTLGHIPVEIYGSSETGGIAWRQQQPKMQSEWSNGWQPMPGIKYRIAEDTTLEICSPHLPENNWFRTADHAIPTVNGKFLLTGRIDRIVKLEGKRISLDAIERKLKLSSFVIDARVFMLDKKQQRQRIAAVVVLSAAGKISLAKMGKSALNQLLRNMLIDAVELIALPRSWRYLEALPVNMQGKTTYNELAILFERIDVNRPKMPVQRLLTQNEQCVELELMISPHLIYFEGHFNQAPILPGVVQVDWAIAYAKQYFKIPSGFRALHALKFQQIIQPKMTVILELVYDAAKFTLTFRLHSAAGQHASGRILFGE